MNPCNTSGPLKQTFFDDIKFVNDNMAPEKNRY